MMISNTIKQDKPLIKNVILELTRIVQEVSLFDSATRQVEFIVDSISEVIEVDVCSLYRLSDSGEMVLLASHGLDLSRALIIPAGKGLVGLVARSRHPINLDDAASHPNNYPVKHIGEEVFKSLCGVPLVTNGTVIGVLVVQRYAALKLEDVHEAFLVTLASQLALLVAKIPANKKNKFDDSVTLTGVVGSPGLGIGRAVLIRNSGLYSHAEKTCDNAEDEISHWHNLIRLAHNDLKQDKQKLGDELSTDVAGIFDVYQMLLNDPSLSHRVELEIRAGFCLMTALRLSIQYFSDVFRQIEDPYLRARHEDMFHLGNKLYDVWQRNNLSQQDTVAEYNAPVVLVGAQISASDIISIPDEHLVGIVSFDGSALSHTAVLANALGIPAIMGTGELKGVSSSDRIIVDGNSGQVILRPLHSIVSEYRHLQARALNFGHKLEPLRDEPAITQDGTRIELLTNTGLQADILPGLKNGAEGIGLYRTEIPFMVRDSFPTEDEQIEDYRKVFTAYAGKPVYMRTLDIGGDKQLPYYPITGEDNPALGWRGIRFTLDNIQLMMTQVRAMIRSQHGADQLHILLPMVSSSSELNDFISLLDDACEQLSEEGFTFSRPKVGVMVEVPAAISQLRLWHEKIDFISIGSNDLSQYLLALDRNNARVANRFSTVHPAVIHEITRVVSIARDLQIPVSLCGEMAANPVAVLLLLGMGIRKLSMSSAKLLRIKLLIRSVTIEQAEQFLRRALLMQHGTDIYNDGVATLERLGMSELLN